MRYPATGSERESQRESRREREEKRKEVVLKTFESLGEIAGRRVEALCFSALRALPAVEAKVTVDCTEMREHSCSLSTVYTSGTLVQGSTGGFVEVQHSINRLIYAVF